jgi:hypothetical protein
MAPHIGESWLTTADEMPDESARAAASKKSLAIIRGLR